MTRPLTITTIHGPIDLHPAGNGQWIATCPPCMWASHPTTFTRALRAADLHSDLEEAPGMEDDPHARIPNPGRWVAQEGAVNGSGRPETPGLDLGHTPDDSAPPGRQPVTP